MASALTRSCSTVSGWATRSWALCCIGVAASIGRGSGSGCGGGTVSSGAGSGNGVGSGAGSGKASSFSEADKARRAALASAALTSRLACSGSPAAGSTVRCGDHHQASTNTSSSNR